MMDFDNTYCGPSLINMCIQLEWRENSNLGTANSEYGKKKPMDQTNITHLSTAL
jgi:hypothetical protein